MQKWEYLFLHFDVIEYPGSTVLVDDLVNDPHLGSWARGKSEHEIANYLGERGWELVAHTPYAGSVAYGDDPIVLLGTRVVFKRPKP